MIGMPKRYEARIYNEWVRHLLDTLEPNVTGFSDAWAEVHYVKVTAPSVDAALQHIRRDHPAELGFTITHIEEMQDNDY
tara:strand:+ start:1161 stop:1397 length:237 start_codon:yes stop_codon:yes gene_type:complete